MQSSMIYSKIKSFFPNDIQNINFSQLTSNFIYDSHALSFLISSNLPHLSLDQIHSICRKQQKNVMQKIQQIKKIDLYKQIATVCPSQKDLRTMPVEEVTTKINQYTAKMLHEQRMKEEMEEQMDYSEEQNSLSEDSSSNAIPIYIDEINYENYNPYNQGKGLFEDYNAYLPWNDMGIYDIS